jgi:DNA helicase-2/ATP-dependent DNA helicase PcrA
MAVSRADIFAGLNQEQRRAVEAVQGPVCILAGAGSGKTTTIMRRIANQVATRTFAPSEILAVTFTDKAATEMRTRVHALGVDGIRARTFHSAALAQLRHLAAEPPGQVLPTKAVALRQIANSLPKPYKFRPAADLATEVEWAKNRCIPPDDYIDRLGTHEPPIDQKHMAWVYREYERRKRAKGLVDFEDLLALTIDMYTADSWATERFRTRYKAFTVDEYQDVNLLQQRLLDQWLGERDNICVVGDDYQSIYSFTGATARYLLEMPRRFRGTLVVRLETNYRSTPDVLDVANRLAPKLGGADKVLRPTLEPGPRPDFRLFASPEHEVRFVAETARSLNEDGVPWEHMAVLYRTNYRSEEFEEGMSSARIPFQVRGGGFLARHAARRMLQVMKNSRKPEVAAEVRRAAERNGYVEEPPDGLGEQEQTRQKDLARLIELALEFDDGSATVRDFAKDLVARFGEEGGARGINLLTYHRAKGLEFDAVFLPRLNEGELPFRRAQTEDALAEERRLLYVGITRARRYLYVSHIYGGRSAPSRFLAEIGAAGRRAASRPKAAASPEKVDHVVAALKKWRFERAQADGVPAYVVMHDTTLQAIAEEMPKSLVALARIPGIGPTKLDRYGSDILEVLDRFR